MKINTATKPYAEVVAMKRPKRRKPMKPNIFFHVLIPLLSCVELFATRFSVKKIGMEKLGKKEPALILMNHSGFVDMQIAFTILFPRVFNTIASNDAFIGKAWIMRLIGCIPTQKYVSDPAMVRDMHYALHEKKHSVLMYPEACYSFDGKTTVLPDSLGKCVKMMKVPLVMIRTQGAFHRNPLYNNLRRRKVQVSAEVEYLLSKEQIAAMTPAQINAVIAEQFGFDSFRWQQENGVCITEPFRADSLNRVLYKCPRCMAEGKTVGQGTQLTCTACGKTYTLTELGYLEAADGDTAFNHIPDWYAWQRQEVRREIDAGTYSFTADVDICMQVDFKRIYKVGSGHLTHDENGFHLTGCDGQLDFVLKPEASHTIYADYYWYEMGDVIGVGDSKVYYFCFPKGEGDVVAKTRLAAEEMYKLAAEKRRARAADKLKV